MFKLAVIAALVCSVQSVLALYAPGGPVTILNEGNFDSRLKNGPWMVEFYAPWCGHCKSLAPEWEKAAKALSGIVNVGAVDADSERSIGGRYGVQGFPTIKFMYHDGSQIKAVEYKSGRTAEDIINFAMDKAKALALKRIGKKASSSGGSAGGGSKTGGGFYSSSSGVVNLNEASFPSAVMGSGDLWFVEFYAPWCGHCKNLKPEYIELAKLVQGKVKVGAVNCDEEKSLCSQFGVQGFPTVKWFGANKQSPEDYQGERTAAALSDFALKQWGKTAPPPEVHELVSPEIFQEHCTGDSDESAKQLCFIAFLPDILDTKASGRNAYVKAMRKVAEKYKDRPYSYLWAVGGSHPELERNMDVGGFGYPALAALSPKRNVYVPYKGALDPSQLQEFIDGIRSGAVRGVPLMGDLAQPASVTAWDGKDGKVEEVEEFSLDDIMGDEL